MIQGERPPHERIRHPENHPACVEARGRLERFLTGDQSLSEDRALHAHLARCSGCNARYRETLLMTARLERDRRERAVDREARLERTQQMATAANLKRARTRRWRAAVLPIGAVLVIAQLLAFVDGGASAQAKVEHGGAQVGEQLLDASTESFELARGDWLTTFEDSRLAIQSEGARAGLDGAARVLIERLDGLTLRLERGALEVEGACTIRGRFGLVEVSEGRARITVEAGNIVVENRAGAVRLVDALGSRAIEPGRLLELAQARP
jgi:hypothetical protein